MKPIHYKIVDSISKIKKTEWESLFGAIPEGYQFYKTLEESNLREFSFYYLILYQGETIILIAPLFVTEFHLDIVLEDSARAVINYIHKVIPQFLFAKTLFCGSPFGENGILGINQDVPDKRSIIHELVQAMNDFSKEKKVSLIIFKDFLKTDTALLSVLQEKGFFRVTGLPSVITDLNFSSMDEYLASLSHATRKNLRRKIKKATDRAAIRIDSADSIETIIDEIYQLYLNTYNAGKIKFEKLTKEYFIQAAENFKPHCKFFLYYVHGKLGAFNLCFVFNDLLIDKFIGFDYELAYTYNLYFLSWYHNIAWAIKNGIRYYQVGQTDYHPKIQLGGKIVPLYSYVKHTNWICNSCLQLLSNLMKQEDFAENMKDNGSKSP